MAKPATGWAPRLATEADIPAISELIPLSVRGLQGDVYSNVQMEAAISFGVFAVDRQLVRDRTYFVVEDGGRIVGCGGWSKRRSNYGGDSGRAGTDPEIDPRTEPARIRAFFVHPDSARRGIGRSIMQACESAVVAAGFKDVSIAATLTGESLYASFGYSALDRFDIPLPGDIPLPCVRMARTLAGAVQAEKQQGAERE
jgi:N-acetylglutamate synthase-like GNAT family acetyltransferase